MATNANMTLNPAALGATANNFIGRSQYADPFLNAKVDDFQIYDRGLGEAEIAALAGGAPGAGNVASYRFDEASGATATDSSGRARDATIVSPPVNVVTPDRADRLLGGAVPVQARRHLLHGLRPREPRDGRQPRDL